MGASCLVTMLWAAVPKVRVTLSPQVTSEAYSLSTPELLPSSSFSYTDTGVTSGDSVWLGGKETP